MKAIIKNGEVNNGIQSCFISQCGVKIVFHNNALANKFALALNAFGVSYVKSANIIITDVYRT